MTVTLSWCALCKLCLRWIQRIWATLWDSKPCCLQSSLRENVETICVCVCVIMHSFYNPVILYDRWLSAWQENIDVMQFTFLEKNQLFKVNIIYSNHRIKRWLNWKQYKWKPILAHSALALRVRKAVRAGQPNPAPLLFLHSYIGWLRNSIVKFRETRNFDEIILNFVKFREIRGKFCGTQN